MHAHTDAFLMDGWWGADMGRHTRPRPRSRRRSAPIEHEAPWSDFVATDHALWNREIPGKAVIHVD